MIRVPAAARSWGRAHRLIVISSTSISSCFAVTVTPATAADMIAKSTGTNECLVEGRKEERVEGMKETGRRQKIDVRNVNMGAVHRGFSLVGYAACCAGRSRR